MKKSKFTRERIVDQALSNSSAQGINALTIGSLADALGMSKSGLFAHFGSRESLQLAVVEETIKRFTDEVVLPAMKLTPGKKQLISFFKHWVEWSYDPIRPGGCPMASAAFDFDNQPGDVRKQLADGFVRWRETLKAAIDAAKKNDLNPKIDSDALVMQIFGLYFSQHVFHWLLDDKEAGKRTIKTFSKLLD
jgi:AcrR family transcriptional regulator